MVMLMQNTSLPRKTWFFSATLLLASLLPAIVNTARGEPAEPAVAEVDIVGLRLGMTPQEAQAALKAHNPRLRSSEHRANITIKDSNGRDFKVGTYLRAIEAAWGHGVPGYNPRDDPSEKIVLQFAPPPAEPRLEHIAREVTYPPGKGPAFDALLGALRDKYGEATHSRQTGTSLVQLWQYTGGSLSEQQFGEWSNKSGIMRSLESARGTFHALSSKPPEAPRVGDGGTLLIYGSTAILNPGLNLGIVSTRHGHSAFVLRAMLADDKLKTLQNRADTWAMGKAALDRHEQKLRGEEMERQVPRI